MSRVAVVTGSNKGIGFGLVQGLCKRFDGVVYLTSRDDDRGKKAVAELNKLGLHPEYHQLDVTDRNSVIKFRDHIKNKHGGLDILINNAGVIGKEIFCSYEDSKEVIDINYRSIVTIQELIYPIVRNNGRILNISSDCGHLSNLKNMHWIQKLSKKDLTVEEVTEFVDWFLESKKNGTFNPEDFVEGDAMATYRLTKIALSALTIVQQKELESRNISVNSVHPGFVQTDMTTSKGFYTVDQAIKTPLYLVLDAPQSLKGAYIWYDGQVVDWYDYKADWYFKIKTLHNI